MVISSPPATSLTQLVNSPQPLPQAAAPQGPKPAQETPNQGVVVKLSDQAQQLNRSETQGRSATRAETQVNVNTERAEPRPQERREPPGIQFMEGENKNGRISTFA